MDLAEITSWRTALRYLARVDDRAARFRLASILACWYVVTPVLLVLIAVAW
jgi:hypothetical protein